jgi:ATP-dependent RNA helicase DeaD
LKFSELPLKESVLKGIAARGYETPTDIQAEAIPLLMNGDTDFVGQAQTGTGKTAAFALPLLSKIDSSETTVQALILSPTRELANQINEEIKAFSKFERIKTTSVYGGISIDGQIRTLTRQKPQIVVGTPGRVLDLIKRGKLKLDNAKFAVLDEADEMLDMGFLDDVNEILSRFSEERKTWMFSATMPRPILNLIKTFLKEPAKVTIQKKTLSNENITQTYYGIDYRHMTEGVCRILESLEDYYGIIFCRTKIETKNLSDYLNERGFTADALHGDMSQQQRDITMKKFKAKRVTLLVCTDVAARGIDVDHLSHVINYGLPQDLESYVHRIGRTGRAGMKGEAISIVERKEMYRLKHIERLTKAKIEKAELPKPELLKGVLVRREVKKFESIYEALEESDSMDTSFSHFEEEFQHLEKDALLKVMFTHLFSERFKRYDRTPSIESRDNGREGARGAGQAGNSRFFVNIGKEHGVTLDQLLEGVSSRIGVDQRDIRRVDIKDGFSFFEVPSKVSDEVLGIRGWTVDTRKVRFELTKARGGSGSRGPRRGGPGRGGPGRSGAGRGGAGRGNSGGRGNFRSESTGNSRSGRRPSFQEGRSSRSDSNKNFNR